MTEQQLHELGHLAEDLRKLQGKYASRSQCAVQKPDQDSALVETLDYLDKQRDHFRRVAENVAQRGYPEWLKKRKQQAAEASASRFEERFNAVQRALDTPPAAAN